MSRQHLLLLLLITLMITSCSDTNKTTSDQVEDLKPRCIEHWPEDPQAKPTPPLNIDNAGQVLWTKEVPGGTNTGPLAMAGDRLAYLSSTTLVILDTEGNFVNSFQESTAFTGHGPPVADEEGNFYFGAAEVISVTSDGQPRWHFALGGDILGSETTYTSLLTLSPDGILYFSATDGFLYAVRATDGTQLWRQKVGLTKYGGHSPYGAYLGIGDVLIAEKGYHDRKTGTLIASHPVIDGEPMPVNLASFTHLFGYRVIDKDNLLFYRPAMDKCGDQKWSFPSGKSLYANLVGFNDTILTNYGDEAFIYSSDGEPLVGPAPLDLHYFPKAIGADGTLYYNYCTELYQKDRGVASVQAYSPQLELLWSVELGKSCTDEPFVLADDGRLYVLRSTFEEFPDHLELKGLELTAIQTASPGLANTAYPTLRTNNRRTGWIGGPQ